MKRRGLEGEAGLLTDLRDGLDVPDQRPGGAVGAHGQPAVGDLPGQGPHLVHHARPGPGQPDVGRGDAEVGHKVEQAKLVRHRGIRHRRRLQPVPESLIIELHPGGAIVEPAIERIPVVDQIGFPHGGSVAGARGGSRDGGY